MKESMKWVLQHFPDSDAEEVICDTQKMIQAKSYNRPGERHVLQNLRQKDSEKLDLMWK